MSTDSTSAVETDYIQRPACIYIPACESTAPSPCQSACRLPMPPRASPPAGAAAGCTTYSTSDASGAAPHAVRARARWTSSRLARVCDAPRRRFDGSRRSPGWMPLPPARPHKPAGVASCVASPIGLRTHGGTRVSNRSRQEAAVELGDGQWRDRPSCWAHTRHSPCTCPCSPTHARTRRRRKSAKGFATAGCRGGIKRRSHPPKTPSLLLPRQQRR